MSKLRPLPKTPEEFVNQAATVESQPAGEGAAPAAEPKPAQPQQKPARAPRATIATPPPPAPAPAPVAPVAPVLDASDRVMKQMNFDLSERQHTALKELVATMPAMSVRKFLVAATLEKMERVRVERGG